MSSWRNIRFDFAGSYGGALRTYIGIPLLVPLTVGILYPYSIFRKQGFIIGETRFGVSRFEFGANMASRLTISATFCSVWSNSRAAAMRRR